MRRRAPLLPLLALTACSPIALANFGDYDVVGETESDSTSNATADSSDASNASGSAGDDSDGSGGSTSATDDPPSGEGPPYAPPSIAQVSLTPTPIHLNGPITVEVAAAAADGVRMELDDGTAIELTPQGDNDAPTTFVGTIPIYTGLANGEHTATLTPWRGALEGANATADYTVSLPKPGSERFWETGDLIGDGFVAALGVLPDGDIVELGTRYVDEVPRCYLRRRDKDGGWWKTDVIDLLDAQECTAIDLKVRDDGTLAILLTRHDNGVARWWLGEMAGWGAPAKNLRVGTPGEFAAALAVRGDMTAVCGSVPMQTDAWDAALWLSSPDLGSDTPTFDYRPTDDFEPHRFGEAVRDCTFAGDELVMVGEVNGPHEGEWEDWHGRHFVFRYDPLTKEKGWLVASVGLGLESGATAVAIDDVGRVITAGYRCGVDCEPMGMLEVHDREELVWHTDLGAWPTKGHAARALLWSPAGYAVLASGGPWGSETAFMIRAYAPLKQTTPLWTYVREDADAVHMALTLALGPYAEIWAGGFGETGYPAIAQIAG